MGSVAKVFKKVTRAVKKPVSKITKGIAKGIAKVGKSVMRGVAKLNKKLGPVGSIALAIAMPYALQGLSTGFANLTANYAGTPFGNFLKSIGQVGQNIKTGYNAVTGKISKAFGSVTNKISEGFAKMGKGNNIFSKISDGAKNLYRASKNTFSKAFGKQGKSTVEVFGEFGEVTRMDATKAADLIQQGKLSASDLGKQFTTGEGGWFQQGLTKGQKTSQKLISDTINEAHKSVLDTYSDDAMRFFNDVRTQSIAEGTYLNDMQISETLAQNGLKGNTTAYFGDTDLVADKITKYDFDISKSKDYIPLNEEGTEYMFTGKNTFNTGGKKSISTITKRAKTALKANAGKYASSLLSPKTDYAKPFELPVTLGDMTTQAGTNIAGYQGTDIAGTEGGTLFASVYGSDALNSIKNYYKNMNIVAG